jgi:ferritin-like metal-binding protein YciE
MGKLSTLRDLLLHELSDLHSAETQIIEALPKMVEACSARPLAKALREHLAVTKKQLTRLNQCFRALREQPSGETCAAMKGILAEGAKLLKEKPKADPAVFDAALIGACQRVEHYEIAGYGCARTYAQQSGETKCSQLLQQTLDEEIEADELLSDLAVNDINIQAQSADGSA